jgi:hypothetical protein
MAAEDQGRSKGDDHQHDVIALSRMIGTAIENYRDGERKKADAER